MTVSQLKLTMPDGATFTIPGFGPSVCQPGLGNQLRQPITVSQFGPESMVPAHQD